jgi:hypothetical protein
MLERQHADGAGERLAMTRQPAIGTKWQDGDPAARYRWRMRRHTLRVLVLLAACAGLTHAKDAPPTKDPVPPAVVPVIEPKAVEILKTMSTTLAGARTLRFTAVSSYESPSLAGPALVYLTRSEVMLQRPDKLRIVTSGDGAPSELYYDGKTMMAYAPAEQLVAIADAPPTIDAMLQAAFSSAAIYFPFTDFLVSDPYADMAEGMRWAFVVGQSRVVGGITTDVLAVANDDVFLQLWIGAEDHLPRMARAVFRTDPSRLRQAVEFSDWKLGGDAPPEAFSTTPKADAKRIGFARPDVQVPGAPDAKPATKPAATPVAK